MKKCSKCGSVKPYGEFYKNCKSADGLTYYCKACHKAHQAGYYGENKDELCRIARKKRESDPEMVRAKQLAY